MLALIFIAVTTIQFAHVPDWLMSKAKPETALYGISLDRKISAARHLLGKAESVKRYGVEGEEDSEATYTWHRGKVTIEVETEYTWNIRGTGDEEIVGVTVKSDAAVPDAKTSRGVHLGGTLDDLVRAYGSRYQSQFDESFAKGFEVIFTFSDESQVAAAIDDDGKIIALRIRESTE